MEKEDFANRLTGLRMKKGVSARDMSLSIGQSPSYINNIERCKSMPSLIVFFYICEYLEVTPQEYFATEIEDPSAVNELLAATKGLSTEKLRDLIAIVRDLQ